MQYRQINRNTYIHAKSYTYVLAMQVIVCTSIIITVAKEKSSVALNRKQESKVKA